MSIIAITAAGLVCVWMLVFFANQTTYSVLFSNLSTEDAGKIVSVLEGDGVSYRISPAGDSILVPKERVAELRLNLASTGLPQGGGVGFEIFDAKNFGATEFVQQLNYQRALQGELSRTVNSLDEIQSSRVHIVVPQKSLFVKDQAEPTASVILKIKPGRTLKASQVEGITHLVASSIEGLDPKDVMIVDGGGDILSRVEAESDTIGMSGSQGEYRKNMEKTLADRVQSMLEKVVGPGKAVVRVSAELDFQLLEKTEETYDAEEPVIRSLRRKSETSQTPARGGESTVAATSQETQDYKLNHDKTEETINYEISRVVSKTVMPVGEVER
ncbi:MAG: flagellar M-ring protein FliF, partial [Deltaproteobacteria bacterium]|nr:flagellar M-ring protein FliF [Deltaproteobacteria bacterium]